MFNELRYQKTDEFKDLDDLREWMKYQGHLWFFIEERYYFMTGSHKQNQDGVLAPWWYITNGDYRNPAISDDERAKILWEFWSLEELWNARIFNGKSFADNFEDFIFYS